MRISTPFALLFLLVFPGLVHSQDIDPSGCILMHYDLDNNALDLSGNNLNGQIEGASPTENRYGNPSSAMQFDGAGEHIIINNNQSILGAGPFSLSGWVMINGSGGGTENSNVIFSYTDTLTNGVEILVEANDSISFSVRPNNGFTQNTSASANLIGEWTYFAVVCGFTELEVYINGILIATEPFTQSTPSYSPVSQISIGADIRDSVLLGSLNGRLDEIKIFDCQLTAADVGNDFLLRNKEIYLGSNISIYPNPSSGLIHLNHSIKDGRYKLFNLQGQLVRSGKLESNLDLLDVSKGVYMLEIINHDSSTNSKHKLILD